ncbi:mucin-5AC-like isoform X2 [Daphnia pulex]|uniref:mucin-5AC-like isoform X2 n=1 Tax=Daphnia pulex TaxID=6669 RepID=UPI001EDD09C1|nr:mucin-5AC-like isoform X2 [Daphnia pulex]
MKLVHFLQLLLLGVAVYGRAIEEKIADTRVVTGDAEQLPYRFRYNVASQDSGDYKSQTESRDAAGVVTGMYRVLQPDVTYEGDCQQQQTAGSINPAGPATSSSDSTLPSASLKDVSTAPINPSAAAFLSRPVLSAVPGLINPLTTTTTDVQDSARETFIISRPSQQQDSSTPVGLQVGSASPSAPVTTDAAAATSLSQKIPADIDRLWQSLGPATGVVPTTTSNGNSAAAAPVKAPAGQQQSAEEIVVESLLPEGLSTPTRLMPVRLSLGNTQQTLVDVAQVETTKQQSIINQVPETVPLAVITGKVQSTDVVPDSILSLLETFEPTKRSNQNDDDVVADPLEAQPSGFSERMLKDESLDSSVDLSAVESAPEESSVQVEETIESKTFVESDEPSDVPVQADETAKSPEETIESKSIPQSDETAHEEEEEYSFKSVVEEETIQPKNADAPTESESEKERSLSTLTQSALGNVKNFTAPLTQLISSSVQNLTNPVTALFNTFNKNKLTTTVAPSTVVTEEPTTTTTQSIPPAGKVETDDQDIPSGKLIVTDVQNQEEDFPGTIDGALPADIPPVSQHTKQTILDTPAAEEEVERIIPEGDLIIPVIQQNLESISLEVNDPAAAVVVEPVGPSAADDIVQDSAEPTPIQVSDGIPVDAPADVYIGETLVSVADPAIPAAAEGESSKVAGLEETPGQQQVRADVLRETSSWNAQAVEVENAVKESKEVEPTQGNAELVYQQQSVNADEGSSTLPETYASSVIVAEPVPVIYSHQVATGPFFVHQPAAIVSPQTDYYPMSVRQGTARSIDSVAATPYGLRVHKFVPTYGALVGNAPPTFVYNQHRRQGHYQPQQPMQHYQPTAYAATRFIPAAAPIRKKHGQTYGMRYATVQQATPVQLHQTPFKKLHHVVRPKAPKQQPIWSPLYSTHVY